MNFEEKTVIIHWHVTGDDHFRLFFFYCQSSQERASPTHCFENKETKCTDIK